MDVAAVPDALFPVTLAGERILVEELTLTDAEAVAQIFSDLEVVRYLALPVQTLEDVRTFLRSATAEAYSQQRGQYHLKISLRSTSELVGTARIGINSIEHRRGDVGYAIRRELWGQGLATEALGRLLKFGFEALNLHRIEAIHPPDNIASGRVMTKVGMHREALLRHHRLVKGDWWDSIQYAILSTDRWLGDGLEPAKGRRRLPFRRLVPLRAGVSHSPFWNKAIPAVGDDSSCPLLKRVAVLLRGVKSRVAYGPNRHPVAVGVYKSDLDSPAGRFGVHPEGIGDWGDVRHTKPHEHRAGRVAAVFG